MDNIKVIIKYLTSFFKTSWSVDDYPLRYREQTTDESQVPRWVVQVINWWGIVGTGDTREDAYQNLSSRFEEIRQSGKTLHRPGKKVPIEFASTNRIEMYPDIAKRFLRDVMGFSLEGPLFISDESSLWDFGIWKDEGEYLQRIQKVFNVDASDIESGNLADIFERIHKAR